MEFVGPSLTGLSIDVEIERVKRKVCSVKLEGRVTKLPRVKRLDISGWLITVFRFVHHRTRCDVSGFELYSFEWLCYFLKVTRHCTFHCVEVINYGCTIPLHFYYQLPFSQLIFTFTLQCNPIRTRGNFGLKLQNSPKLPDIHARFYCNRNEQS